MPVAQRPRPRIYFANVGVRYLGSRGLETLSRAGFDAGGNWLEPSVSLSDFKPDVVIYSPYVRPENAAHGAVWVDLRQISGIPLVVWTLAPDEVMPWDVGRCDFSGWIPSWLEEILERAEVVLANSEFTRGLIADRLPSPRSLDVCHLGIDTLEIHEVAKRHPRSHQVQVLWPHRWAADKGFSHAISIILELAASWPEVEFVIGRANEWFPSWYAPQAMIDRYQWDFEPNLRALPNVRLIPRLPGRANYFELLSQAHIVFTVAPHETFGLAMLEAACAGASCVTPTGGVYDEVHWGSVHAPVEEIPDRIGELIDDPVLRTANARNGRRIASGYDVERAASRLIRVIARLL